jgi:hypothetical protein
MMSPPPPQHPGQPRAQYFRFFPDGRPPEPVFGFPTAQPVAVPDDPLVPGDFRGWLSRVLGVVRRSFGKLALLHLGVLTVLNLILAGVASLFDQAGAGVSYDPAAGLTREVPLDTGTYVLFAVVGELFRVPLMVFAAGASTYLVVRAAAGQSAGIGAALRFAAGRFLPALAWAVLAASLIIAGSVALVLPGLYLAVVLSPLMGVVFVERGNLSRCFTLVNPRFFTTLTRLAFSAVPALTYVVVFFVVLKVVNVGSGSPLAIALEVLLGLPLTVLGTAVLLVTYAELRGRERPGTSTRTLVAQLTAS